MSASNLKSTTVQADNLDVVFGLTTRTLEVCQKLSELGVHAMKESVADCQRNTHKALAASSAQELFALQASLIEPAAEKARNYLRQTQEIAAAARADFQKMAEVQYESTLRHMRQAFDSLSQNAPAGSENALNAWQSAVTSTAAFYESMQQATRHAIEFTGNHVMNAATAASGAAQKASAQAAANR